MGCILGKPKVAEAVDRKEIENNINTEEKRRLSDKIDEIKKSEAEEDEKVVN